MIALEREGSQTEAGGRRISGSRLPHVTVEIIEEAGHHLQAEVPEIVGPLILNFLKHIDSSASIES